MPAFRWIILEPDPSLRRLLIQFLQKEMPDGLREEVELVAPEIRDAERILKAADEFGGRKFEAALIAGKGVPVEELIPDLDCALEGYALVVSISVDPRVGKWLTFLERPLLKAPKCQDMSAMAKKIVAAYMALPEAPKE